MERMWTIGDVMSHLQVTHEEVERLVADGEFPPPVRIGSRLLRWRPADVARWQSCLQPAARVGVVFIKRFHPYRIGESKEFAEQEAAILLAEGVAQLKNADDADRIAGRVRKIAGQRREWLDEMRMRTMCMGRLKDWNGIGRAAQARDGLDVAGGPRVQVRFLKDWREWSTGQVGPVAIELAATLCTERIAELANTSSGWTVIEELAKRTAADAAGQ